MVEGYKIFEVTNDYAIKVFPQKATSDHNFRNVATIFKIKPGADWKAKLIVENVSDRPLS